MTMDCKQNTGSANSISGDPEPYRVAWQDSEIYLRRLYQDLVSGGGVGGAVGTPLYAPGQAGVRASGAGLSGHVLYVPEYGGAGGINYAPPAP